MRDYAKVSARFWLGATGRQLRQEGPDVQVVALYLITAPNSNMIGMYPLSIPAIANDTGLTPKRALRALKRLGELEFSEYDEQAEVVWVLEMARFQVAEQLAAVDKRCKGVQREYDQLPANRMLGAFFDKHAGRFHLTLKRGAASPLQAPSKALRSQEQEQEQEKEQEQEQDQEHEHAHAQDAPAAAVAMARANGIPYKEIVDAFNKNMTELPAVQILSTKRRHLIEAAWNESTRRQSLSWWISYFEEASGDAFLNGTGPYNSPGFQPIFEDLLKDDQLNRIYDRAMARLSRERQRPGLRVAS